MTSPYWHLFILGVDPEHQGRGHGGRLIAPVLAEADRAELPCYLETTEESNTRFYERHGFTTTVHRAGADLPEFWTMIRAPR